MAHNKFIYSLLLAAMTLPAAAQEAAEKPAFNPHAYIQLQGGGQYTLGEAKFSDLLSPTFQLGIGYQFNPWLGARIAAGAYQSKGGFNGYVINGVPQNTTYKYKYVAPGIDVVFNLSNAFCGYNPSRVVNVSAFVGGAANIAFSNDEAADIARQGYNLAYLWDGTKVRPAGRAGLALDFRLSDAVSLGLEANANVLSDKYNSKKADNPDWYFNVLAGLKINLGKTTRRAAAAPVPAAPVTPPAEEKVAEPAPAPVQPAEEKKVETIRRDIFFKINSYRIDKEGEQKIAELADFLNTHKDAKLTVTGYADAQTGTDAINNRIARQRAAAVVSRLVHRHKIDKQRIISDSKGSKVQPFAENDQNRVSICVSE